MKTTTLQPTRLCIAMIIACALAFIPAPHSTSTEGWRTLALFIGFILACLLNAGKIGELALILICALALSKAMPIATILAGFGNPAVWLVLFAFFAAIAFRNTSLGHRIAYLLIVKIGWHPLGIVYAISLCDCLIAPFVPNTNARGAGILYPITQALADAAKSSSQQESNKKIGAFLFMASFQLNLTIGALFLTAMATNPLAIEMLNTTFGLHISWIDWFLYASVPIILAIVIVPWVIYCLHKPDLSKADMLAIQDFARTQLAHMGKFSRAELLLSGTFTLMIAMWALGNKLAIHPTTTALAGIIALLAMRIVSYKEVLKEEKAWDILLWLAPLIAITDYLNKEGVISWIVSAIQTPIAGMNPIALYVVLALFYVYIHYFLTSLLVHLQAFFLPFVGILAEQGMNPLVIGMVFAMLTCISPSTTHYGTGTAAIYYSAGYMSQKEWWRTGFIVSAIEILLIAGIGFVWVSAIS